MWRVGETFDDAANSISVTITYGNSGHIFSDGFEGGDTSGWSVVIP